MKKKILVGLLITAMAAESLMGCGAVADDTKAAVNETANEESDEQVNTLTEIIATQVGDDTADVDKEESVYVIADANGSANDVIVSDWLKNRNGDEKLTDVSNLTDITNVKGEETYEDENGSLVWNAGGKDIYYQGHTDKEIPVDVRVTYYLDGELMSAEEIAGRQGRATIRFDYDNKEAVKTTIKGEETEVYVPFTVMSALILPTDTFGDISVTNGKVMSEGNNNIVMGLAFPGLKKGLDLDEEKLEEKDINIPDYVEVNATTSDFKLDMTVTVVLADALSNIHLTDSIDLSELDDSIGELTDATGQLEDGTGKLADGVKELNDKSTEFADGTKSLYDGIVTYTNGVATLADGIGKAKDGADKLSSGAKELSDGATTLNNAVQGIDVSALGGLSDEQKAAIKNSASGSDAIKDGAAQLSAGIAGAVEANVKSGIASDSTSSAVASALTDNGVKNALTLAYMNQGMAADTAAATAEDVIASLALGITSTIASGISIPAGTIADDGSLAQTCYGALSNAAGTGAVAGAEGVMGQIGGKLGGLNELKAGASKLASGASELKNGANELSGGMSEIQSGASKLNDNSGALVDGAYKLYDGTGKLTDGIGELLTGANDLNDGMIKFDEEGISKLTDAFEGKGKTVVDRIEATMDAGKNYHTFTDLAEGKEGNVKFIIRTAAVK